MSENRGNFANDRERASQAGRGFRRHGAGHPSRAIVAPMKVAYTRGLHELGDGLYAYLQPDGGWGWSNAGLIVDGSETSRAISPPSVLK